MHNGTGKSSVSFIFPMIYFSIFILCKEKKIKNFSVDFFALRQFFWYFFSLCLFSSDIF